MKRYIMRLEELYKDHRIGQRAEHLASVVLQVTNARIQEKYFSKFDALDQERLRYMHAAEKNLALPHPLPMGETNGPPSWKVLEER